MNKRKDYIKIRASLGLDSNSEVITKESDGKIHFSDIFLEILYKYEEHFRAKLILPINEVVGLYNWAIRFIQVPIAKPKFLVDIYVDDEDDFSKIVQIVQTNIFDIEFQFFKRGTVLAYLNKE